MIDDEDGGQEEGGEEVGQGQVGGGWVTGLDRGLSAWLLLCRGREGGRKG